MVDLPIEVLPSLLIFLQQLPSSSRFVDPTILCLEHLVLLAQPVDCIGVAVGKGGNLDPQRNNGGVIINGGGLTHSQVMLLVLNMECVAKGMFHFCLTVDAKCTY